MEILTPSICRAKFCAMMCFMFICISTPLGQPETKDKSHKQGRITGKLFVTTVHSHVDKHHQTPKVVPIRRPVLVFLVCLDEEISHLKESVFRILDTALPTGLTSGHGKESQ